MRSVPKGRCSQEFRDSRQGHCGPKLQNKWIILTGPRDAYGLIRDIIDYPDHKSYYAIMSEVVIYRQDIFPGHQSLSDPLSELAPCRISNRHSNPFLVKPSQYLLPTHVCMTGSQRNIHIQTELTTTLTDELLKTMTYLTIGSTSP